MPTPILAVLTADKITPGTVRFTEADAPEGQRPLSIYLPNEVVESVVGPGAEIGTTVKLTVERA
jgi:hypothetical protein